jgi:hypothetical protein
MNVTYPSTVTVNGEQRTARSLLTRVDVLFCVLPIALFLSIVSLV